jgi:two-component system chemotaxis sensor kinase CheA
MFRGINLSIILGDLYALGKCEMQSNIEDGVVSFWNIFIVTDKGREAIEDVIVFIADNCKLNRVADFDIFNEQELTRKNKENEERELRYNDTHNDTAEDKLSGFKIDIAKPTGNGIKTNGHKGSNHINVDASKLDTLMYLVTELVTTKSELLLAIQKQSETKVLETAEKIEKLSKLFSDNALSIRLVSLQEMLLKYQRLIRDLSNLLGKKVNFTIKGEDTELDKNMVDIIAEPIMHLIRNCMDHGIEVPEKRKERGKDETGIIFFNAFKSGNNVYVQVGDDGTGIDTDYVYRKAVDQEFIQPGAQLTEKEIYELIFLPGFSTAQSLTEVSGRGVGMDIVRKKIQEIRGEIFVESAKGKGTTFTIKLQQTISIIDTLLIVADNSTYAIPIEDVELCDLEEHDNIFRRQSKLIEFNGELIPFLYLREKFSSVTPTPEKEKLIIINKQEKKYAIIADKIIGQHQAVIKPLNKTFQNINFISGASILGDGSIALLLDTDKLKELLVIQYEYV